ncbi:ribonuclease Z [Flavobacterium oreochromis]|uniref:Ribonuclease Z n=1 Tax=Flavobacterium columnare TaxID=996 RepID=A0A246G9B6_9FLAO|nr:ribonuclease Z [Flavobacterium oreochromis]OWP76027.1 ribonuclease Z [Flavobacterium oreochromis]POR20598.1 ribonuclease Z [Flavobacterium columnare]QYS85744.1 ribonuclease Z [Flavobacterium oreochromis]
MKVDQRGHTTIIKDTEGSSDVFLQKLISQYNTFKDVNLIIDITHDDSVNLEAINSFIELSDKHKALKKSFVLVAEGIDFNEVPDSILVVPTLLEAHDIIEMEEIERDLGF